MNINIKKLKEKGEIIPATYDPIFKSVIQDDDLKDYTAFIVENTIGRPIDKDNIFFVNPEFTKKMSMIKLILPIF